MRSYLRLWLTARIKIRKKVKVTTQNQKRVAKITSMRKKIDELSIDIVSLSFLTAHSSNNEATKWLSKSISQRLLRYKKRTITDESVSSFFEKIASLEKRYLSLSEKLKTRSLKKIKSSLIKKGKM